MTDPADDRGDGHDVDELARAMHVVRSRVAKLAGLDPAEGAPRPSAAAPARVRAPAVQTAGGFAPAAIEPAADDLSWPFVDAGSGDHATGWLAAAIRSIAARHARLAGELVVELLAAQGSAVPGRLSYAIEIAEIGELTVTLADGQASVVAGAPERGADFALAGPAMEFAELVAGGAGPTLPGVRVTGSARRYRRLCRGRRRPLGLRELAQQGVSVWPGLLLLALTDAIDPRWTAGHEFKLTLEIAPSGIVFAVVAEPGQAPAVLGEPPDGPVDLSLRMTERACLAMFAGVPAPLGETATVTAGALTPLYTLLEWCHRAQGTG